LVLGKWRLAQEVAVLASEPGSGGGSAVGSVWGGSFSASHLDLVLAEQDLGALDDRLGLVDVRDRQVVVGAEHDDDRVLA